MLEVGALYSKPSSSVKKHFSLWGKATTACVEVASILSETGIAKLSHQIAAGERPVIIILIPFIISLLILTFFASGYANKSWSDKSRPKKTSQLFCGKIFHIFSLKNRFTVSCAWAVEVKLELSTLPPIYHDFFSARLGRNSKNCRTFFLSISEHKFILTF